MWLHVLLPLCPAAAVRVQHVRQPECGVRPPHRPVSVQGEICRQNMRTVQRFIQIFIELNIFCICMWYVRWFRRNKSRVPAVRLQQSRLRGGPL